MEKNYMPKKGICIDLETSGTNPHKHQILSIGAIVFDTESFNELDALYVELKYDQSYTWDAQAEQVHGLSIDYLSKEGVSLEDAVWILGNLIFEHFATEKVMVLGHHVGFDLKFLNELFDLFEMKINWHHVVIDTAGIFAALTGEYRGDEIFMVNGFKLRGKHNALDDARMTLASLRNLKNLVLN